MKMLALLAGTLIIVCGQATAVPPTNTTYYTVQTDTNGVLVNAGTNLVAANGIATTGQVAAVESQAVSGIASAAVAQAAAAAAVRTNHSGPVTLTGVLTISNTVYANSVRGHQGSSLTIQANTTAGSAHNQAVEIYQAMSGQGDHGWLRLMNYMGQSKFWIDTNGNAHVDATLQGNGSGITGITPGQVGVAWHTNQVLALDGTTNTLIYLGVP